MLTQSQIDRFMADGYVAIEDAFPRSDAQLAVDHLVGLAAAHASEPAVVRVEGSDHPAVVRALDTTRVAEAIDALVGPGRWERRAGYGTFPIRFPSEADPGDAGWHIDGSFGEPPRYLVNLQSRGRALLALVLFTDVGLDDAPTRIRVGSHLPVARALAGTGDVRFSPERDAPEALNCPVRHATGPAGTVYLCHPFLVHAATWPHRGTAPRVIGQPAIHHAEGMWAGGFDYDTPPYSPVERAVRAALGATD